jgi:general secretion pathway protein K
MTARGQVLIIVLWTMGLVSAAAGILTARVQQELRLGHLPLEAVQREALADAVLRHAAAVLLRDDPGVDHLAEPWATGLEGGSPIFDAVLVGPGSFRVGTSDGAGGFRPGLLDAEGSLNLNAADGTVIAQLLTLLAVPDADPDALAAAIVDWRTADDPEDGVCAEAVPPCHNGPFSSLDEVRLVPGMTPAAFEALRPYVTVYGGSTVNINTASAVVLDALGCPGEALVAQRESLEPPVLAPETCPGTGATSSAFLAPIETWLIPAGARTQRRAVIARDGTILAWTADSR